MLKMGQPGKKKSLRLRLSALLCLLLLLGASTAEVMHHHPGDFPVQKASKQGQQKQKAPEVCPLCMAMHAVLPSSAPVVIAPVALVQDVPRAVAASHYFSLWSFDLFGRPPPVGTVAHV